MVGSIIDIFNANKALTIGLYFTLMIVVTVVATLLERLCNVLKFKTKLSSGVVAGILLGVITSLPELITAISSVATTQSGAIGTGDIIGSNMFDLFIMGMCVFACILLFADKKVNKVNLWTLIFVAIGTVFVFFACLFGNGMGGIFHGNSPLVWHGFNFFSIFILGSYIGAVVFMILPEKKNKKDKNQIQEQPQFKSVFNNWKLWAIILLIVVTAIALIAASVFLTYTSESLIYTHWSSVFGESFGGALLLGVVTSLPEIVCCVNLCIHKQYNMVIDTMVGSCAFNLSILTISNIVLACFSHQTGPMYEWNIQSVIQITMCLITVLLSLAYLIVNIGKVKDRLNRKQVIGINATLLSFIAIVYVVYIILGFLYNN